MNELRVIETKVYKRGLPTDLDVKKLQSQFSNTENGVTILFSEIEDVIGFKRDTCRFKTIVMQWRKLEEKQGRLLSSRRGQGLFFADNDDIITVASTSFNTGIGYIKRSVTRAKKAVRDKLSECHKAIYDKLLVYGSSIEGINRINSHRSELPSLI